MRGLMDYNNTSAIEYKVEQTSLEEMVALLKQRGISKKEVLNAMLKVPRHLFVPKVIQSSAYIDSALSIGYGQTISQPYIVAFMTEAADLNKNSKVLEIGTGSGYQAAVLAEICKDVYTVEIVESLADHAVALLKSLGHKNVHGKVGDGYEGWPERGPFDAILVTAAAPTLPENLLVQLKVGGCMIIPLETGFSGAQVLVKVTKTSEQNDHIIDSLLEVSFVPMVSS